MRLASMLAGVGLAAVAGCFVEDPPPNTQPGGTSVESSSSGPCNQGSSGCACFPNGTCSPGLVCDQGVCEPFDEGTTTSGTATTDTTIGATTAGLDTGSTGDGSSSGGDPPAHVMFTMQATFNGLAFGGLSGADAMCTATGQRVRPGPWVAVLSDGSSSLASRISIEGEVVNTRDEPLADDEAEFSSGTLQNIPGYDQVGSAISRSDLAWTGSIADNCLDWSSDEPVDVGTVGLPTSTELWLDTTIPLPCSGSPHIYCLSQ